MSDKEAPVILYSNNNDHSDIKHGYPNMKCGLTIEQIIAKDCPKGYSASLITQAEYKQRLAAE